MTVESLKRDKYDISPERGFLPDETPLTKFETDHEYLDKIDELGQSLPELLEKDKLRNKINNLEEPPEGLLEKLSERESHRLYSVMGFIASAYVHKIGGDEVDKIPSGVAVPLYEVSEELDIHPILSYDGYALRNWTLEDEELGINPHNTHTITNFVSLKDEEWFIVIHVVIENKAGPAIAAAGTIQQGVKDNNIEKVRNGLEAVEDSLYDIVSTMERMPEHNSPDKYGESFRPYIDQFKNIEYEGVEELDSPQFYRGETGAQSSLFPTLDAILNVSHEENPLVHHVDEMREYMPKPHREYIKAIENGPDVRSFVRESDDEDLVNTYNNCIEHLAQFREIHYEYAEDYIMEPLGDEYGTGGTPYGQFLPNLIEDTRDSKI